MRWGQPAPHLRKNPRFKLCRTKREDFSWLLEVECADRQASQKGSDQGPNDGNTRVAPVGVTLAGNRKHCVSDARAKVARWINRIARGPTQRKSDRPYKASDQIRAQT